jgi:hypothetical protein
MNRPGGNVTGVNVLGGELSGKQLGLLHDLVPKAATIAALFDARVPSGETVILRDARDATTALGQKLLVLEASTPEEIDAQFARLNKEPADAMLVTVCPFFFTRAGQSRVSKFAHDAALHFLARPNQYRLTDVPWLSFMCPACQTVGGVDLRTPG